MNLSYINPFYRMRSRMVRTFSVSAQPEFIAPVADRMLEDVRRAQDLFERKYANLSEEEKIEWLMGLKGCLNYTDLNRIEGNCDILGKVFEIDIPTKIWEPGEAPRAEDYQRIRDNVETIRAFYVIYKTTPLTPNVPLVTYQKYNDLEKILLDVYTILLAHFYHYSGEISAGDEIGALL